VRGEREVPLRPLSVAAAVELFIERARAVAPNFTGSGPALGLVQEICNRLDGIPLAIELAAARVRHLPLRELLGQLENTLAALVGGARDLPDRQRTMRAALDWSYELLDGDQRRRFRALAPFRGGFDLKAAAAPIAALGELVDASLVLAETNASGASRFRLLDVTREYATERAAAAGELDGLTRRHATHFLELAEEAEPELRGARQRAAYTRLLDDEGNFRVALGWALEAGEADIALRLAGALWMFWRWAGLFIEGRAWLEAALAAGDESSLEIRCQGLWGAGWLAYHRGDYDRTAELGARMLELLEGEVSPVLRRNALTLVGNAALAQGRSRDALSALEDALHLCEPMGASWHLATSQLNHGTALLNANRLSEAQTAFERALAIYEARGDQHFAARTRIQLAYTALESGDTSGARRHAAEAMRTVAEARDAWGIAEGLEAVAAVGAADAPRESVVLAGAAQRLRDRIGMLPHPQDAILNQRQLEAARRQIADFDLAFAEGQATAVDEAIRLAGEALEAGSS
jgi:tetratricopeptide (TPR) repeat protein